MVSHHINRNVTKAEIDTNECAIAITSLTMLLFQGMQKTMDLWTREVVECCKWGLTGHPSRNLDDSHAESTVDYGGPA